MSRRMVVSLSVMVLLFLSILGSVDRVLAEPPWVKVDKVLLERMKREAHDQARMGYHHKSGKLRFFGTKSGNHLKNPFQLRQGKKHTSESAARAFMSTYGPLFGIKDEKQEVTVMKEKKVDRGRSFVRFQQRHKGVPVMAGELIVQMDEVMDIVSANGEAVANPVLDTTPSLDADEAWEIAIETVSELYHIDASNLSATDPQLWIYNPTLLGLEEDWNYLVWRLTVAPVDFEPIEELVLVDAHSGQIVLHFNEMPSALYRKMADFNNTPLPEVNRDEGQGPTGISQLDNAYDYAGDTYLFYLNTHGRDSWDGRGTNVEAWVRFCFPPDTPQDDKFGCPIFNAFGGDPMLFGSSFVKDDIFAHEYTHLVTSTESRLYYYMQSGAINESFSDIWGEFVDLTNGRGDDSLDDRWLHGEDNSSGHRSLKDPPSRGDPDRMTSPLYSCDPDMGDRGGVHTNSGVGNKAAYLIADGDTFNGHTVEGIGLTKTAKIFYEVQTNLLTSGSDYEDLYHVLYQGCLNLVGTSEITLGDCLQVQEATLAVEMDQPPMTCSAPEAPVCDTGQPSLLFFDDLENPETSSWTLDTITGSDGKQYGWYYPQNVNPYDRDVHFATSGRYSLWGDNLGTTSEYSAVSPFVFLPVGKTTYLHFKHLYDFAQGDGAVLEYQEAPFGLWLDAGPLFANNGYTAVIPAGALNPLGGREGFTGRSSGFLSSRLDLSSLAGRSIRFRFRIGNDLLDNNTGNNVGWIVDDVQVYTCEGSCTYDMSPLSDVFPGTGGTKSVTVTTQEGCEWAATANDMWISVPFGPFSGSGAIDFVVDTNPDEQARIGSITTAGQLFSILQKKGISLEEAVDNLVLEFSAFALSDVDWFGQEDVSLHGGDAAQSGAVTHDQLSTMAVSHNSEDPAYLSFFWKVSSEEQYDKLKLKIDWEEKATISGEKDWRQVVFPLPAGQSFIEWIYEKDEQVSQGADCGWVDTVEIGPCYISMGPREVTLSQAPYTGLIVIGSPSNCSWSVLSLAPWITINSGTSGMGSGTVSYSVSTHSGDTPRTGYINVEGRPFKVTQWGTIGLGEAVDYDVIPWTTGGDGNWTGQPTFHYYGQDAAQTPALGPGESSWIETGVTGPVGGFFYWKISAEQGYDFMEVLIDGIPATVYVNGVPQPVRISGEIDWTKVHIGVGQGTHTIRWVYHRDVNGYGGLGWLDRVGFVLLDPTEAVFGSAGGAGSVEITYPEEREWKAFPSASWITVTSPSTGIGNGTLTYSVDSNPQTIQRKSQIYIAGRDLVITQEGVPCTYGMTPESAYLGPAGGTGTVSVTAPAGCNWEALPDVPWITVTQGESGTGNGTVSYSVAANGGTSERIGELEIGDVKFTIRQMGSTCVFTVDPGSIPMGSDGGTGTVNVQTNSGCAWTAEVVAGYTSWIAVTSGASGTGNGTTGFSVSPNPSVYPRAGWVIVANHAVPIYQEGISCGFTLDSTEDTLPGEGGSGGVLVTSILGCTWTAESNDSWINITSGEAASGSYLVQYAVEANPDNTPRAGSLTIAGQTYTISQEGIPCSYTLAPEGISYPANGGEGLLHVTTPGGCLWTAFSDSEWISLVADSGSGKATLRYTVAANPDPEIRSGMITIEGKTHAVIQAGTVEGLQIDLPRTGQTLSYEPGDDGDPAVQAGLAWSEPRFTNLDGTTPVSDDLVLDRLTGLTWTREGNTPGPPDCVPAVAKNWQESLNYVSCLNANNYLGYSDWRLTNAVELETLFHAGEADLPSWLYSQGFSPISPGVHWTSSSAAINPNSAWTVDTWGYVDAYNKNNYAFRVWPVRGEGVGPARPWRTGQLVFSSNDDDGDLKAGVPWPIPRFIETGECLRDSLTGLLWPKAPDMTSMDWVTAVAYANNLSLCGHDDWRLANRKELLSLANRGADWVYEWLNSQGFQGLEAGGYWSSTTYAGNAAQTWAIGLGYGDAFAWSKTEPSYVLPVSGGLTNTVHLHVSPAFFDFGPAHIYGVPLSQVFTLVNLGTGDLTIDAVEIGGDDAAAFSVDHSCTGLPYTLASGEECAATVTFAPQSMGTKTAFLRISSSAPDQSPLEVSLAGEGGCAKDLDSDEDADGIDLALLAANPSAMGLDLFASIFGRAGCYNNYGGSYCMITDEGENLDFVIDQTSRHVTFTLWNGPVMAAQGTGEVQGNSIDLTGFLLDEGLGLTMVITFSDDRQTFSGSYETSEVPDGGGPAPAPPSSGTFTGSAGACE